MQTLAKRGLQTALVTGGLLMLGTGIAGADEDVNPDAPAGPLDLNVTIPVDVDDNAVATTPGGQVDLPGYHGEISTEPVTEPLQKAAKPATEAAAPVTEAAVPVTDAADTVTNSASETATAAASKASQEFDKAKGAKLNDPEAGDPEPPDAEAPEADDADATAPAPDAQAPDPTNDPFRGNKVSGDLTVPIQITGNAMGLLGDAVVTDAHSEQNAEHDQDITTRGDGSGLAGNAVALDWALPVQISGNAGGLLGGSGSTSGSVSQTMTETGAITTDGSGGAVSGNVGAGHLATPVQVTGNALAPLVGNADSDFEADSASHAGGPVRTHGEHGAGSGNVGAGRLALPLELNGNAVGGGGNADAATVSPTEAVAGGTNPGLNDIPSYVQTDADNGALSGNIVQPQGAGVGKGSGNALTGFGNALAEGSAESTASSGGFSSTTGEYAAGSANLVDVPVALPGEFFGAAGAVAGNADTVQDSTSQTKAGDGTFTSGNDSALSGNTIAGQLASTLEGFGIGGSAAGNATGTTTEDKEAEAGGYNGTLGDNSAGSGNLVQAPLAAPVEAFGVGGSALGLSEGQAEETKVVTAGGGGNTDDDYGAASSNLVGAPVSLPAQVFGLGAAAAGQGNGTAGADTTTQAGGDYHATGMLGAIAANVVEAPVSLPAQAHAVGTAAGGIASGTTDKATDSSAGGETSSTGTAGAIAGNVVQAPIGGAGNVFGLGGALGGLGNGAGVNDVASTAGGHTETNGDAGALAGNVVSAQALPVAQAFGDAVSLLGIAGGEGANPTDVSSGGDIDTSGVEGALSGDILDVPAAAVAQIFGNSASLGGAANGVADNVTTGTVGGIDTTEGSLGSGSGFAGQLPIGALAQVYNVPAGLLANVTADTVNDAVIDVAGHEPQINVPIDGSQLPATGLPTLPALGLPGASAAGQASTDGPTAASVDHNPLTKVRRLLAEASGKKFHIQ